MISHEDMEVEEEVARIMENAPNATAEPPTPRPSAPLPHERRGRDEDMPFYLGRSIEFAPKPIHPPRLNTPRPDWSPSSPVSPFGERESALFSGATNIWSGGVRQIFRRPYCRRPSTGASRTLTLAIVEPTTIRPQRHSKEKVEETRLLSEKCEVPEGSQTQGKPDKK